MTSTDWATCWALAEARRLHVEILLLAVLQIRLDAILGLGSGELCVLLRWVRDELADGAQIDLCCARPVHDETLLGQLLTDVVGLVHEIHIAAPGGELPGDANSADLAAFAERRRREYQFRQRGARRSATRSLF